MRLIFLIEKMIKHRNKLPKAVAAPLSLVICRARLAALLKDDSVKHELLGSIEESRRDVMACATQEVR